MANEAAQQLVVGVPPCAPGPAHSLVLVCQIARGVERAPAADILHPQQRVQKQRLQQQEEQQQQQQQQQQREEWQQQHT